MDSDGFTLRPFPGNRPPPFFVILVRISIIASPHYSLPLNLSSIYSLFLPIIYFILVISHPRINPLLLSFPLRYLFSYISLYSLFYSISSIIAIGIISYIFSSLSYFFPLFLQYCLLNIHSLTHFRLHYLLYYISSF